MILEADLIILLKHLPLEIRAGAKPQDQRVVELPAGGVALADVERELIHQALDRCRGNQSQAAELLGIERDALRRRLVKYGYLETTSA